MNRQVWYHEALCRIVQGDRNGFARVLRFLRKDGDIDGARMVRAVGTRLREMHM